MERSIDLEAPLDEPFPYDAVTEMYDIITDGFGPVDLEYTFKKISDDISHDIMSRSKRALELTHSVLETNNQEGIGLLIEEKAKTATVATLAAYLLPNAEAGATEDYRLKRKLDGVALQELSGARALMFGLAKDDFRSELTLQSHEVKELIDIGGLDDILAEINAGSKQRSGIQGRWAQVNELERAAFSYLTVFASLHMMNGAVASQMAAKVIADSEIDDAMYERLMVGYSASVLVADEAIRKLKKAEDLIESGMAELQSGCNKTAEEASAAEMLDWLQRVD